MKVKTYWPAILWAIVILILTLIPSHRIPESPDWHISFDKLAHSLMFMALGLLLLIKSGIRHQRRLIQVFLLLAAYGLLLETLQLLVPSRSFSWLDVIANIVGIISGNFIYLGIVKLMKLLESR